MQALDVCSLEQSGLLFQQLLAAPLPIYPETEGEPMRISVPSLGFPMKVAMPAVAPLCLGLSEAACEVGRHGVSPSPGISSQSSSPLCKATPDAEEASSEVAAQLSVSSETVVPVPPGLDPPPGMPSHGSLLHALGSCRPCGFFWKADGCQNGKDCQHCHLCPEGKAKQRKKQRQAQARLVHTLVKTRPACATPSTSMSDDDMKIQRAGSSSASDDDTTIRGAGSRRPSFDSLLSYSDQ